MKALWNIVHAGLFVVAAGVMGIFTFTYVLSELWSAAVAGLVCTYLFGVGIYLVMERWR